MWSHCYIILSFLFSDLFTLQSFLALATLGFLCQLICSIFVSTMLHDGLDESSSTLPSWFSPVAHCKIQSSFAVSILLVDIYRKSQENIQAGVTLRLANMHQRGQSSFRTIWVCSITEELFHKS